MQVEYCTNLILGGGIYFLHLIHRRINQDNSCGDFNGLG